MSERAPARSARPTLRCLREDLEIDLPDIDVDLGSLPHPLLDEARRLSSASPRGQRRVACVDHPPVFRVRAGRWRGATWVDQDRGVLWLLAGALRREGSRDDAYEHFCALHREGRLLPTSDDHLRLRAESAARLIRAIEVAATEHLHTAREHPGGDHEFTLPGGIPAILRVVPSADMEEIWLAVRYVDERGETVGDRLRDLVFAAFERAVGEAEWEWRADWPTRDLQWYEVGRLGIREA